ncbi:MAG: hypothetical protein ACO1OQ_00035, partial [Rufibacter sp.]
AVFWNTAPKRLIYRRVELFSGDTQPELAHGAAGAASAGEVSVANFCFKATDRSSAQIFRLWFSALPNEWIEAIH